MDIEPGEDISKCLLKPNIYVIAKSNKKYDGLSKSLNKNLKFMSVFLRNPKRKLIPKGFQSG